MRDCAKEMLTAANFGAETAYLARPSARGFERPYGRAWALALHGEMVGHDALWASYGDGFAAAFPRRFHEFLPLQTYPIRVGTHFSTAFALFLALEWAHEHDSRLAGLIVDRARVVRWPPRLPAWEPGGDEFLSGAQTEAMQGKTGSRIAKRRIAGTQNGPGNCSIPDGIGARAAQ